MSSESSVCEHCGAKVADSRWSLGPAAGPEPSSLLATSGNNSSGSSTDAMLVNTDLHIEQALKLVEASDFEAALLSLNRAIVDATDDRLPECFALRGYTHLKLGDFQRAETDCTEAINRSMADSQTYAWRAAALGEQNQWPRAFDDLCQAHDSAVENVDEYLALMDSYIEAASEYYRQIIKDKQETAETFFDRGWVYFRAGKSEKASRDFKLALEMDSKHGRAAIGLAGLSLEAGDFNESLENCRLALAADPDCEKELLPIRIKANHALENRSEALDDLKQLKKLSGENISQLLEIAQIRIRLGENVRAISDLTAVLQLEQGSARALKLRADAYAAIRNYELAVRDYTKYLRQFPESLPARIGRGHSFLNSNQIEAAVADFDRALEINNVSPDAFLGRSQALIKAGNLAGALTECQRASRLNNSQPEVFATLAEIHYLLFEYSRAIEEFSRAASLCEKKDPKQQAVYIYRRGNARYELDQLDEASKDFQLATKLNPNHAGAWIWTAAVAARTEDWSGVVHGLENAVRANPAAAEQYHLLGGPVAEKAIMHFTQQAQSGDQSASLFRSRGLAHLFLDNHEAAYKDFERSLKIEPGNSESILQRGRALCLAGKHKKAINDLTKLIREDRSNHRARYYRAASRLAIGETHKAAVDMSKAIKLAPEQSRYHLLHGEIMQSTKNWSHALKCLDLSITTDPNDPLPYRRRASIYSQTGQHLRAISDLNTAHQLSPQKLEILVARGNAFNRAEEYELAQHDFEAALTQDNRCAAAYAGRGFSLAGIGQYDGALIWLTKAIHRFIDSRELSSILFMRGKIYYRMGRYEHAINDFTCTLMLVRDSRNTTAAVLTARSAAYAQNQMWKFAEEDLAQVVEMQPTNQSIRKAHQWVASGNRNGQRPALFAAPETPVRPIRPPVVREPVARTEELLEYESIPPYDGWIVKSTDMKEYGPATLHTIQVWLREGRLDVGMQLLRSDWAQWKLVEKAVPSIVDGPAAAEAIQHFPELNLDADIPTGDESAN